MTLDIEGVLAGHEDWDHWGGENRCLCGAVLTVPDFALSEQIAAAHRAHVAAVLREQIAAWLVDAETIDLAYDVRDRTGKTGEVLAALAAQVAPSRVPGEES